MPACGITNRPDRLVHAILIARQLDGGIQQRAQRGLVVGFAREVHGLV
jgi:hypothetical protein